MEHLHSLSEEHLASNVAKIAQQPDPDDTKNVEQWTDSAMNRQTALLQETAKFFIGTNLPASMGENPFYRTFIYKISEGKISMNEMEAINSRQLGKEMCRYAEVRRKESYHDWESYASRYGGTLLVDHWTTKRTIGTVGVCVAALTMLHVLPLLLSSTHRCGASNYVDKLESIAVAWSLVYFACTDGSSNMILLGEDLQKTKHILPCLCAAHGFSLTVHYIAKVFETKSNMFSKVAGVIAYFNRNPQRLSLLREKSKSDICFIKLSRTRLAYQTLALLRALRLREAAQEAMIRLKKIKTNEDEIIIDAFTKTAEVAASLDDDNLWRDVELFCRLSLPVLFAMRQVDRGTPMAGFVYWLHYHVESQVDRIMEKRIETDNDDLAKKLKEAIVFVWDKRHRPVLSFAYLTNPLFYAELAKEEDVFGIDSNFRSDIDEVLVTMAKKRYTGHLPTRDVLQKALEVKGELIAYLTPGVLSEMNEYESTHLLAVDFWTTSSVCDRFPNLAWYARRVHAMPVVTSRLETFFSHNVVGVGERRHDDQQAALLAATTHQEVLNSNQTYPSYMEMQAELLKLVQRCEDLLEAELDLTKIEETPELYDLSKWLEDVQTKGLELLYNTEARRSDTESESEEEEDVNSSPPRVLLELDDQYEESKGLRRSRRTLKPLNRLNRGCLNAS